ncbi:SusC/RagA family TonB-linked outer membrane protein [Spirosoma sp. HMF4905]|uniref:SusC/RagA family TonB-linked outer membrane protein n=2 Tax=Spirosoma arboris TaxID=2682092 RepID=A0A7K1S490_9BACT|nr:SusC/RagA family TonB-linked outer membrane protein [Spirosoma arboris]
MKISFVQVVLLVFFSSMTYAINSNAQLLDTRLSLQVNNQEVVRVLSRLEKLARIKFVFSPQVIKAGQKVTIQFENERLGTVLEKMLRPLHIQYEVSGNYILLSDAEAESMIRRLPVTIGTELEPAELTVTGTVADETGEGLPGVNVLLKGTQKGTNTDQYGKFRLNVPDASATLVFSFVGYESVELIVGNRTTLDVRLKTDQKALGEVVVVGYGTQSRRNVTGSVAKIDMKQTENLPNTNVAQALRGRVAGVQFTDNGRPGQGGTILVRGQRSITAGNNPLIILDGIFFDGSLNDINPGDVESMEILKDASATAIYGARAANGVILITSKKGTSEKPTIRLSTYYGASSWSYKPKLLTPERYIEKTLEWRRQSGLDADPAKISGYLTATEAKNYAAGNVIDPWEVVSQAASIQNYDLNISGRSGRTNYFISGNYNNEKGLIFNDNASRTSVRINLDNQITNWLKIGVNAQYAIRDLSGNEANVANAYGTSPFNSVWLDAAKTDPNPNPNEDGLIGPINFDAIIKKNREVASNLFANFYGIVDIPFVKGLTYRINYSPNYRWYNLDNFSPIYQRNNVNSTGSASRRLDLNKNWVLENILTYTRQIATNHSLDFTLLYGRNEAYYETVTATGSDFTGSSDVNGWNNLGLAKIQTNTSAASDINAISSMARLNYRFKDRYLLTLTTRRDGNSVFGANHKYGVFPSAALAWIASDEAFFKQFPMINLLKFRASYGSVGNQAISAYQSLTQQGQVQYVFGDGGTTSTGLYPANLANPNLKWETTTTANIGVDFEIWKGRIGGTIEYYNMDTKDLLLSRQLPSPTGFANILTNVGATNNKGVEITLNTMNLKKGGFEWTSNLTFSTNKNRIVHIYQSDVNGDGVEDNDVGNKWFIGQPISVAYDYKIDGVYQQNDQIPTGQKAGFYRLQDVNNDGKIDASDRQVLGTLQPKYRWSFTNNFRYGHLSLMVMLNALQGWIGSNPKLALVSDAGSIGSGNFPGRAANFLDDGWWTPENKSNTVTSLLYTNPYNHGYYQSRDFVRIQEVSLAFDFPRSLTSRLKMNNLKAYVSGRNLYTFTNWQGMDPESGNGPASFPTPRTVSVGLNMSF